MFQHLGYPHQGNKNPCEGDILPRRRHAIGQGKSPSERKVAKVNVRECVTTLKITVMNQGDVKNANTQRPRLIVQTE